MIHSKYFQDRLFLCKVPASKTFTFCSTVSRCEEMFFFQADIIYTASSDIFVYSCFVGFAQSEMTK